MNTSREEFYPENNTTGGLQVEDTIIQGCAPLGYSPKSGFCKTTDSSVEISEHEGNRFLEKCCGSSTICNMKESCLSIPLFREVVCHFPLSREFWSLISSGPEITFDLLLAVEVSIYGNMLRNRT